jgi:hypothetical protein
VEGNRRASRNGRVSDLPPETFASLYASAGHIRCDNYAEGGKEAFLTCATCTPLLVIS